MNYTPLQQEQLLCFKLMQCQLITTYAKAWTTCLPPNPHQPTKVRIRSTKKMWSKTLRARLSAKILRHEIEKGLRSSLIPKLCVWGMVSCWPVFENIATEPKYKFQAQQCFKNQNHNKIFLSRIDVICSCCCSKVQNWIFTQNNMKLYFHSSSKRLD